MITVLTNIRMYKTKKTRKCQIVISFIAWKILFQKASRTMHITKNIGRNILKTWCIGLKH